MFNEIEIKIGRRKCIITRCKYRTYEQIGREIKMFIDACLELEIDSKKKTIIPPLNQYPSI